MNNKFFYTVVILLLTISAVHADWPRYLGQNYGQADGKIARKWSENGPKVLWQQKVGVGYGGPCIYGNEVYLLDRVDNKKDVLRCFDLKQGKEMWSVSFAAEGRLSYDGSRSTPVVSETHVYGFGPFGDVYCVDRKTHKASWRKNLPEAYRFSIRSIPHRWGFGQSPLLHNGKLILVPCISGRTGIIALDAKTGNEVWNNKELRGQTYMSPMIYKIAGEEHVVAMMPRALVGVNPENGKTLWKFKGYKNPIPIPTMTPLGSDRFFVTGGYNSGSAIIYIKKSGTKYVVESKARFNQGAQIHPAVVVNDYIYVNLNENANLGGSPPNLSCISPNGKILWQQKQGPAIGRGGLIAIDGLLLILAGQSGKLYLLEPSSTGTKELAQAQIFPANRHANIWAPMAFSEGKLLVRDQTTLKCLDLK